MRTPTPEIRQCLDNRLRAFLPELGLDPARDVAWPNEPFEPDTDRLFLRPTCMFAQTSVASLGTHGFERLQGVYQISVFEVAGNRMDAVESIARKLVDHFRGGTFLDCCGYELRIRTAYMSTGIEDELRYHIPVSVNWYCYAQK